MASSNAAEGDDVQFDPAQPLSGIIVCCTSIPAEHRSTIAAKVAELGGVHKYDLTPDVTHLIVGDYDTPKYRHVARERPDIKAMDAAWIEALSELWKNDDEINYPQLETKYQLKPLEKRGVDPSVQSQDGQAARDSLLVCLTGFGDQRDEIAFKVTSNGGLYTGDLTRRCTHLIVNKPEGKKYQAARDWGIHPVTLAWLDQSIARGMILEEAKFDPMLPPEEQGRGAWVTRELKRTSSNKRSRSAVVAGGEEGPRKLRKTASMKLSSQRNNLWGDILGRSTSREYSFARENNPADANEPHDQQPQPQPPEAPPLAPMIPENQDIFTNCYFYIHGFPAERTSVLQQTIATLGGSLCSSLQEVALGQTPRPPLGRFLIVPQTSQPDTHPQESYDDLHVVTEYYIEKCLHNKLYFDPTEHVLGRPFPLFPIPAFEGLVICSAAFTGIELSQVARAVAQLGAKFDWDFRKTTSVLVCSSLASMRKEKLRLALRWGVPVVSADWLWECISTGFKVPLDDFIFPELKKEYQEASKPASKTAPKPVPRAQPRPMSKPVQRTHSEPTTGNPEPRKPKPPAVAGVDTTAFDRDSPEKPRRKSTANPAPNTNSFVSADFTTAQTHPAPRDSVPQDLDLDTPLAEVPSARLNKSPSPVKQHATMPRTRSDPTSKVATTDHQDAPNAHDDAHQQRLQQLKQQQQAEQARLRAKAVERQALSSKLTSLIETTTPNLTSNLSHTSDDVEHPAPRPRRRQILGRAISNASNASSVASRSAAEPPDPIGDDLNDTEAKEVEPPSTQLEYRDEKAQECRAALMSRMMGGSGEVKPTSRRTQSVGVIGGRTLRKR
ncbi:S-M checkpoint control rad4 [Fusarium albosuccineum]|uniref:S-M checkpoint control rad4 n=1 Tax=Fusarium albosuccineum TaxID=1237068 RepID=A0A8H4L3F5_9HYPO|nr:S-M checkpoint control rad4 [Fusarium albosuccineum]